MNPGESLKCLSYLVYEGRLENLSKLKSSNIVFPISKFDHFFTNNTCKVLKYLYGEVFDIISEKGEQFRIPFHLLSILNIVEREFTIFEINNEAKI